MSDAPFELVDAKDSFIDTDWFHHCRKTRTPFVVVRSGDHSADVLWDYVTLPSECDAELHRNLPALERDALAIFERYAIPESHLRVKATMIGFDRLPFDRAKRAATDLYAMIAAYLPATQSPPVPSVPSGPSARTPSQQAQPAASAPHQTPRQLWVEAIASPTSA